MSAPGGGLNETAHMAARHLYAGVKNVELGQTSDRVELFCLRAQGKHLANTWRNYKKQRNYKTQLKNYKNVHANYN